MIKKLIGSKGKKGDKKDDKEQGEMSFLDHLEELRWHIIRSGLAILIVAITVFNLKPQVTAIFFGPKSVDFPTYRFFCHYFNTFCTAPEFDIIQRDIGEQFFTHLKTSIALGFIVAFPYIFWEFWRFIKPGLYPNERQAAKGMVAICSMLFFSGVLFGYFVVTPFAINFLAGYSFGEEDTEHHHLGQVCKLPYHDYLTCWNHLSATSCRLFFG